MSLEQTVTKWRSFFGSCDKFFNLLMGLISKFPIFPIFDNGKYKLSPVSVEDVAKAAVYSIDERKTFRELYNIQGIKTYEYEELIQFLSVAVRGCKIKTLHLPIWFVEILIRMKLIPITDIQLDMLLEGDAVYYKKLTELLGIKQRSFEEYLSVLQRGR